MKPDRLRRRLFAEGLGSLLLAATVIGSGIMAERLAAGNIAVALLANTTATVAALATLIALLGPVSGAHLNPAVSLIELLRNRLGWREAIGYVGAQIVGCCAGAILAHAMFELPLIQASTHVRAGWSQLLAELIATFGLLLVTLGHRRSEDIPWMVACWIGAAYWFTASTSRQPCDHPRTLADKQLFRDPPDRCPRVHRCANCGRSVGPGCGGPDFRQTAGWATR